MQHSAILYNTATMRFHPIHFEARPVVFEIPRAGQPCHHESGGHHTVGFGTMEEAMRHITDEAGMWPTGVVYEWDGKSTPARTGNFPFEQAMDVTETIYIKEQ